MNHNNIEKYKNKLMDIIKDDENNLIKIKEFQDEVWNDDLDEKFEFLNDLAYNLDFFEPNENWRKEDKSFFGKDKLFVLIDSTLKKLDEKSL